MKKFTNYAPGARGIRTESGVVYLDPGQTVEIDPKTIVGALPDLGKKSDAAADGPDAGDLDLLQRQIDDLTKQVETLTADNKALTGERDGLAKDKADLTKQVETLTKPGK